MRAIEPDGDVRIVRTARGAHIHALGLAADGALWGEESAYDPADGKASYRYGPTKQLERGVGLLRDRQGCTWHLDQAFSGGPALVHRKCGTGPANRLVGSAAEDRRFRPVLVGDLSGTALDRRGRLVFRHHGVLRRVAADGTTTVLATGLDRGNFGLALGPGEVVYLAEWDNRRVIAVSGGKASIAARSQSGWSPSGVAWRGGKLYVLEASLHRVGQRDRVRVRRVTGKNDEVLSTVDAAGG